MLGPDDDPLIAILRDPDEMLGLSALQWTELMRRTRRNGLIGRIAVYARERSLTEKLPAAVQRQIASADVIVGSNHRMLLWELDRIKRALFGIDIPVVVMKGAAYLLAGLKLARGRVCTDVDIMVRRQDLPTVEAALAEQGWDPVKTDAYDEAYYRKWMHEIPPLRHRERLTVIDVHHNLLPLTARIRINADAFMDNSRESSDPRFRVFAPVDMVIHSAVHMMYDGDLNARLRDLVDIHEMLNEFSEDPAFWTELMSRARRRRVQRPVFYAIYFSTEILGTSIPPALVSLGAGGRPNGLLLSIMESLVPAAIIPDLPGQASLKARIARFLLFVRSHWLRMPPFMLARHLLTKAVIGLRPKKKQ